MVEKIIVAVIVLSAFAMLFVRVVRTFGDRLADEADLGVFHHVNAYRTT